MPIYVRAEDRRRAQRRRPADQGLAPAAARHGLQGRRRTTRASRRASRSCASSLARGADVRYCDPWVPEVELDGERHVSVEWSRARWPRGRLRGAADRAHAPFSSSRCGSMRSSSSTRATSSRDGPDVARPSSWLSPAADPRRRLHRRGAGGARAGRGATRSCWPTTGTRPTRAQLDGLERDAAPGSRPPTSATAQRPRRAARRPRRDAGLPARRPGQPADRPSASPTTPRRRTSPARGASPRRSRAAAAAALVFASSLHVYGARSGRDRARHAVRRRRATSRTSRRSTPSCASRMHARRAGFGARHPAARDRLRPEPGRARRPRVADRRRQVPPAGRARASRCTLDAGGAATIGVVHVDDAARILLESPGAAGRRRATTSPPRRITVADVAALAEGASRPAAPACTLRDAASSTSTASRSTCAPMRFLVTGATGFLGWRAATLLARARARRRSRSPGRAARARAASPRPGRDRRRRGRPRRARAGRRLRRRPALRRRPRPGARARATRRAPCARTPARPLNLLDGCLEHGAGARLPLDRARGARAAARPLRALQAPGRGGLPPAPRRRPTVVRLTSVFGPGQVAWEGATGRDRRVRRARARGRADRDPRRPAAHARLRLRRRRRARRSRRIAAAGPLGRDAHARPAARRRRCCDAAELARDAAGSDVADRDARAASCPPGEDESYAAALRRPS